MKLYKKQITPILLPIYDHKNSNEKKELVWYDEECEKGLRKYYEDVTSNPRSNKTLIFSERYVEIELPEVISTDDITPGKVLLICFDIDKIDVEAVYQYIKIYSEAFPDSIIAGMPTVFDLEVMDKESTLKFLDNIKKRIENGTETNQGIDRN